MVCNFEDDCQKFSEKRSKSYETILRSSLFKMWTVDFIDLTCLQVKVISSGQNVIKNYMKPL